MQVPCLLGGTQTSMELSDGLQMSTLSFPTNYDYYMTSQPLSMRSAMWSTTACTSIRDAYDVFM